MALKHMVLATSAVDRVLKHGDKKYGEKAWLNKHENEYNMNDHLAAAERHLARHKRGEIVDESHEEAIAHVAARLLLALEFAEMERLKHLCNAEGRKVGPRERKTEDHAPLTCTLRKGHESHHPQHYDRGFDESWD